MDLPRRATAEAVGTALLLAAVVGSGIMGERLAGGNVGLALPANTPTSPSKRSLAITSPSTWPLRRRSA
jgi:hypothetical protein